MFAFFEENIETLFVISMFIDIGVSLCIGIRRREDYSISSTLKTISAITFLVSAVLLFALIGYEDKRLDENLAESEIQQQEIRHNINNDNIISVKKHKFFSNCDVKYLNEDNVVTEYDGTCTLKYKVPDDKSLIGTYDFSEFESNSIIYLYVSRDKIN